MAKNVVNACGQRIWNGVNAFQPQQFSQMNAQHYSPQYYPSLVDVQTYPPFDYFETTPSENNENALAEETNVNYEEDLTVRIKIGLLKSIEHEQNFSSNNGFGAAEQLSLNFGVESTTGFYSQSLTKSVFKMSDSNSPQLQSFCRRPSNFSTDVGNILDAGLPLEQIDPTP